MPFFRVPCLVLPSSRKSSSLPQITKHARPFLICPCADVVVVYFTAPRLPMPLSSPSMHKSHCPSRPLRHSVDSLFNFRPIFPSPRPSFPVRSPRFRSILTSQSLLAPRKEALRLQSNFLAALISISVSSIRPKSSSLCNLSVSSALSFSPCVAHRLQHCTHAHIYCLIVNCQSRMPAAGKAPMLWNNT